MQIEHIVFTKNTTSTLTSWKDRLQQNSNWLSIFSAGLYLICITTITPQNNHSKINETAALLIPAPHPPGPPLDSSTLLGSHPDRLLLFFSAHRRSRSFFLWRSVSKKITSFFTDNRGTPTSEGVHILLCVKWVSLRAQPLCVCVSVCVHADVSCQWLCI